MQNSYTFTTEEKTKLGYLENIEDCKFQRDFIISIINESGCDVKKVMTQIIAMISASNYSEMELTTEDTVIRACDDVNRMKGTPVIDNGAINKENAIKNLPSSLR
jgi:hypothetical protein